MDVDKFLFTLEDWITNEKRKTNCALEYETSSDNVAMSPYYETCDAGVNAVKSISKNLQYVIEHKQLMKDVLMMPVEDCLCEPPSSHKKTVSALGSLMKITNMKPLQCKSDHNLDEVVAYLKEDVSVSSAQGLKMMNYIQNVQTLKQNIPCHISKN